MNKILVTIGYNAKLILPDDQDAGAVIAALSRGVVVESHGYGKDEKFTPTESEFAVRRVDASRIVMDDEGKAEIKVGELQNSLESMSRLYSETKKQLDALKAQAVSP